MQFHLKTSHLLIGLGLLLVLVVAISGLVDAKKVASPFDQIDGFGQPSQGFAPLVNQLVTPQPTLQNPSAHEDLQPTLTPVPLWLPDRIVIPEIQLDAPVVTATLRVFDYLGQTFQQWIAPNYSAAGQLSTSASLGTIGNTVLIGHHNIYGEVFGHLVDLKVGDLILVYSGTKEFAYEITQKMILPERFQPVEVRLKNAQWIDPTTDERLTLETCWPYVSNTDRLIIVAKPINLSEIQNHELIPRFTPHPTIEKTSTPTVPPS